MGWTKTPLLSSKEPITENVYDQLKAAIDERYDAVGASFGKPANVSADELNKWTTITSYRSKIESLLSSFYKKSGTGNATTFTVWTKSTLMTACFGSGVTDWPNASNRLILASHFADMQTVLNTLTIFKPSITDYMYAAYRRDDSPVAKDTAKEVCDEIDGTSGTVHDDEDDGPGRIGIFSTYDAMFATRLRHYINYASKYTIDWFGTYLYVDCQLIRAFDVPACGVDYLWTSIGDIDHACSYWSGEFVEPDNDSTFALYAGTSTPTDSFAGIHGYGSALGSCTVAGALDGGGPYVLQVSGSLLEDDDCNYVRAAFRTSLDEDVGPWDSSSRPFGYSGTWGAIYLQADFTYS